MLPETVAGASVMANVPWGTHFCCFNQTRQDLLETCVAFFQAGLEARAFCLWLMDDPITEPEARYALTQTIPDAGRWITQGAIELLMDPQPGAALTNAHTIIAFLHEKLDAALAQGYAGMRVIIGPEHAPKPNHADFRQFEQELAASFAGRPLISLRNFPLASASAAEILDAARARHFVLAKRSGEWQRVETPASPSHFTAPRGQLEPSAEERTRALEEANQKLRAEISLRERAEADLRQQKEVLQTIFDHVPVAIHFIDKIGQLRMANREWERMVGYSCAEIENQAIDVIAEAYPDPLQRQRARDFLANPSAEWADFETKTKDGSAMHSTWSVVRLSDGSRIGIGRDITQRKHAEQEIRDQKEILQTIFDHIPVMINFGDARFGLRLLNRQWEQTLGWSLDEILRGNIDILVENYPDPEYRAQVRDFVNDSHGEWRDFKTTVRDGRVIDTSWLMLHLPDGTNIGIGQDITQRKRAEEALRESEERFRQLAENIDDLFWIKTPDLKRVIYMSPIYKRITGRPPEDAYSHADYHGFLSRIVPEDREIMAGIIRRGGGQAFDVEYRVIGNDGNISWIHERGFPIRDPSGRVYRMAGIARNITEQKAIEARLKASTEQLRALSASLQNAREKEAARIARQIHDDVGGILTSLRWELEALQKMVRDPAGATSGPLILQKLATMVGLTNTTIDLIRGVASELRPSILDDLGLLEAIEWQAQQFQARTGIECRLNCSLPSLPLDDQQSTAVFRIVQEALTNVMRHAHATQVDITAGQAGDKFAITVQDNGRGITLAEKADKSALGLLGMRERAHLIGAEFEITGEPGAGVAVQIRIPVSDDAVARGAL